MASTTQRAPLLPPKTPPSNPTPLTASQEAAVRDLYYKRVRAKCGEEIKAFALCATGRTFSTPWACRNERRAMNACMISWATPEEQDAARREWFAGGLERAAEREHAAHQREKYEAFQRKWWEDWAEERGTKKPDTGKGGKGVEQ